MSERDTTDESMSELVVPGASGGQIAVPEGSGDGTGPDPVPTSEHDWESTGGDEGLLNPGSSPEFDHSLRRRPSTSS